MILKDLFPILKLNQLLEIDGLYIDVSKVQRKYSEYLYREVKKIWPDSHAAISNQEFLHIELR